ncbi:hypothetical protein SDC9_158927 [bioreactor metagenome]|uniref:Uncharacterized protein n=1 Tax=bioreactor metagenome TaxID=1076179 RepID=A0A645FH69_9ZZZZ
MLTDGELIKYTFNKSPVVREILAIQEAFLPSFSMFPQAHSVFSRSSVIIPRKLMFNESVCIKSFIKHVSASILTIFLL